MWKKEACSASVLCKGRGCDLSSDEGNPLRRSPSLLSRISVERSAIKVISAASRGAVFFPPFFSAVCPDHRRENF